MNPPVPLPPPPQVQNPDFQALLGTLVNPGDNFTRVIHARKRKACAEHGHSVGLITDEEMARQEMYVHSEYFRADPDLAVSVPNAQFDHMMQTMQTNQAALTQTLMQTIETNQAALTQTLMQTIETNQAAMTQTLTQVQTDVAALTQTLTQVQTDLAQIRVRSTNSEHRYRNSRVQLRNDRIWPILLNDGTFPPPNILNFDDVVTRNDLENLNADQLGTLLGQYGLNVGLNTTRIRLARVYSHFGLPPLTLSDQEHP